MNQYEATTNYIKFHIKRVKQTKNEDVRERLEFKAIGVISLAKELNIITTEEYSNYFDELYN